METNAKNRKASLVFILLCSAGAALTVVLSAAKYGPGTTHDSAAYMYAAQSLLNGNGFEYFGYPSPFIQWPPLYPLLLAFGGLFGITAGVSSILINSLAFALTVFFAGSWMLGRFDGSLISLGGTLLIALSVPLLQVSEYLWTEMLFVLLFLLAYIELERFLLNEKCTSLVLAAVFSALACFDRYAGVTIVAVMGLFLLFSKKGILKGFINAALYGILSIIPMGIWVIRNYAVSGTLLGVRLPSTFTLRQNIKRTLESIYTWVLPDKLLARHVGTAILTALKLFAVLVPALIAAAFVLFLAVKFIKTAIKKKTHDELNLNQELFPVAFFTVFSAVYIVYLIASATLVSFEPINSRYLIPVYLPAVLGILTAADYLHSRLAGYLHVRRLSLIFLILLYLAYPFVNTVATVIDGWRDGAGGYASAAWREKSGFLAYMRKNKQATYYSNNADVVYVMSGVRTYSPPKKNGPYMYGLEQFKAAVARDETSVLIWFDGAVPATIYNLEELSNIFKMKEIGSFKYGKIYELEK